jgi:pyruvate decarboxylase
MEPGMNHDIYIGQSEPVRKTHTFLWDDSKMASEIDRVITEGVKSKLPVFIYIPLDVVGVQLDASRLETPLDTAVKNESAVEDEIVTEVLDLIKTAQKPVVLADVLTIRHGGRELARELVDVTNFRSFSTPLSKGIIDETHPAYGGVYNGSGEFSKSYSPLHNADMYQSFFPRS